MMRSQKGRRRCGASARLTASRRSPRKRASAPSLRRQQRLDLLAHLPREHRRAPAGADRDDDRRAIDDRREDEARKLGAVDHVDGNARRARGLRHGAIDGWLVRCGDDERGALRVLGRRIRCATCWISAALERARPRVGAKLAAPPRAPARRTQQPLGLACATAAADDDRGPAPSPARISADSP